MHRDHFTLLMVGVAGFISLWFGLLVFNPRVSGAAEYSNCMEDLLRTGSSDAELLEMCRRLQ